MLHVLAALLPGLCLSVYLFGISVLIQVGLATLTAYLCEYAMLRLRGVAVAPFLRDGSACVTAFLIGLAFPPLAPWWLVVVGTFFAIVIAKHLYGGLGNNPFNPAMVAYAAMLVSFPAQMSGWAPPHLSLSGGEQWLWIMARQLPEGMALDAMASATPLDYLKTQLLGGHTTESILAAARYGRWAGASVEWLGVAWLLGGLYLLAKRLITWHAPVAMLATIGALSAGFWLWDSAHYVSPCFHLLAGATMFGAWFIVTDPVSGSTTPLGKLIFGAGVGALVYVIRVWGGFPDAVAFAVLVMNIAVPLIDRYTRPASFGRQKKGRPL